MLIMIAVGMVRYIAIDLLVPGSIPQLPPL